MNMTRILVLVGALGAAGIAALLARGLMGTQTEASAAQSLEVVNILVASRDLEVGTAITAGDLKWMGWPKAAIDSSFMSEAAQPQALQETSEGSVVRARITAGQPITARNVIKSDAGGVMAALLAPGKRAVGVKLNAERGAGGFILPNDRVDIMLTRKTGGDSGGDATYATSTLLRDIRVLAVDQTSPEDGSTDPIIAKTATLELSPKQAEAITMAEAMGEISLILRSLSKPEGKDGAAEGEEDNLSEGTGGVSVVRYGIVGKPAMTGTE